MSKKEYSLVATEPLTEFDHFMLTALNHIEEHHGTPRAAILAVIDGNGDVGTCYHMAGISDMILMQGYIGLDIQQEYHDLNSFPFEDDGDRDRDGEEG